MKKTKQLPPDPDEMNNDRAMWAGRCIDLLSDLTGCDQGQEALGDLLCDIFHWGDRNGFTPQEIENIFAHSREMYRQETMEDPYEQVRISGSA